MFLKNTDGSVTAFSFAEPSTDWENFSPSRTFIVEATGGSGSGARFAVYFDGTDHQISLEDGGIGYVALETLTLAEPAASGSSGTDITVTISAGGVSAGTTSSDSLERGVAFHYGTGSAEKVGFFGMLRGTDEGKFAYIPDATTTLDNTPVPSFLKLASPHLLSTSPSMASPLSQIFAVVLGS